jgi:xanthine/uracil permease
MNPHIISMSSNDSSVQCFHILVMTLIWCMAMTWLYCNCTAPYNLGIMYMVLLRNDFELVGNISKVMIYNYHISHWKHWQLGKH